MPNADTSLHIYQRTITAQAQDSLSVIAALIAPGQTLLDLGMGTGGLGRFLSERQPVVADGVTLNPAEADIARQWYRSALVADLDNVNLVALFGDQQYDCIVCADVLEHLKEPQRILAQLRSLLAPGGRLITSIPNAGYCGLVAELLQGEFRYRPEGLLDGTHLRFFTRTSLQRFFTDNGWAAKSVNTIQRNLPESEFQVAFDILPPAVARYLLAVPDSLTYQFISVLQPADVAIPNADAALQTPSPEPASALFSAQLLLATEAGYTEALKQVTSGHIGNPRQVLAFDIAASPTAYTRVRVDPADRGGFFRIHNLTVRLPNGSLIWQWQAGRDSLDTLAEAPHHDMVFAGSWDMSMGALLLLHANDPWIELPLTPDMLRRITESGARFEACVGWPMSSDYLQASIAMDAIQRQHRQTDESQVLEIHRLRDQNLIAQTSGAELDAQVKNLTYKLLATQDEKQFLIADLRFAQRERTMALQQFNQIASHLQSVEKSMLFRATRPLSHLKGRIDQLLGKGASPHVAALTVDPNRQVGEPLTLPTHPVDIIVPVYRGLEDTRCCLESVLAATCKTHWRLIVINDCSPEAEVTDWLRTLAAKEPRIVLLENAENVGFVATVNRGMALSDDNDVLLLNSDTEVANDWLDRLQHAAYSSPRVATVTPFSNNATIFSYPRFCEVNEMPNGIDTAGLDALFAQHLSGQTTEVPTAMGFCMYLRRGCLQEVGLFDVANFGRGYGEENDFCVRAHEAGWTNLHALDIFVRHAGGVSFGNSKSERELAAMQTLRRLHPTYEPDVHAYLQRDPAKTARVAIDIARITHSGRPVILNVLHDREGGTLRHVRELATRLADRATFLQLTPASGGAELRLQGQHEAFSLHFQLPQDQGTLLAVLRRFQVGHIHFHHLLGHASTTADLPGQLGITHDFTAHDFYSYCPQITLTDHTDRYCGERGIEQCRQCLKRNPAPGGESIESWRERYVPLLSQGRYVIAPSQDTVSRIQVFAPTARMRVVPHSTLDVITDLHPQPNPPKLGADQPLKIVVLGALGKIKGADILEEVALLAKAQNVPVEFHLLGYAYRNLQKLPKARLTVHGSYEDRDLPELLQWLQPDLIWFPAVWPETYSYTLSASLASGLPIAAPTLGAFAERLKNREWTWLCDWQQSATQWLVFFDQVRTLNFCTGEGPIPNSTGQKAATQTQQPGAQLGQESFTYGVTYLHNLPRVLPFSTDEVRTIQSEFSGYLSAAKGAGAVSSGVKSTALRLLVRMRASAALTQVTQRIPIHLQRRIKSWLRK